MYGCMRHISEYGKYVHNSMNISNIATVRESKRTKSRHKMYVDVIRDQLLPANEIYITKWLIHKTITKEKSLVL